MGTLVLLRSECFLSTSACLQPLVSCPTHRHSQHESPCLIYPPIDLCDLCLQDHLPSHSRTFSTKNQLGLEHADAWLGSSQHPDLSRACVHSVGRARFDHIQEYPMRYRR